MKLYIVLKSSASRTCWLLLTCLVFTFFNIGVANAAILYSDDFESTPSNWTNISSGDNKDWTRDSGGTASRNTGPATGANGSVFYFYLETSSGGAFTAGDSAILLSPVIADSNLSLSFDYHMYGRDIGTLSIDVLESGNWIENVWLLSGQQQVSNAAAYQRAEVDLSAYSVNQLRIRATANGNFNGDIAIDNIDIVSTPTGPVAPAFNEPTLTKSNAVQDRLYVDSVAADAFDANGDVLSFSKVSGPNWLVFSSNGDLTGTPTIADVGANSFEVSVTDGLLSSTAFVNIDVKDDSEPITLFSDDFESGFGNWSNVLATSNKNWILDSNGTTSSGTGPVSGASGSLFYAYLETSVGGANVAGDIAVLESDVFEGANINFNFMYHMYGSDIGSLAVDVLSDGVWVEGVAQTIGQQQVSNGAEYITVEVDLSAYNASQLRLRAVAVGGYRGDIAIDNLTVLSLGPILVDTDLDGIDDSLDQCPATPISEPVNDSGCSASQRDSDNDGFFDSNDAFPNDPLEWLDTDGDSIGNNTDADDDGDSVNDVEDAFPLDSSESVDTDNDGIGNNTDTDDDGDGVNDVSDAFPLDLNESIDTDSDGVGNNADSDDDNDGVSDTLDAFPLDPNESVDTDSDGIGNNVDLDDDGDNVVDALDAFPLDFNESLDTDLDGVGNNADMDDDNDGVDDQNDAFPLDSSETLDTDSDGIGNVADLDDDNDSLLDVDEINVYLTNPLSSDTDNDDMPDAWEIQYGLDANLDDSMGNLDNDDFTNLEEYKLGLDPTEAFQGPMDKIASLSLGNTQSCVVVGGELTCWGLGSNYQAPIALTAPSSVAVSNNAACALQGNDVFCWGASHLRLLSDLDALPVSNAVDLEMSGWGTACVVTQSGTVNCWGEMAYGVSAPANGIANVQQVSMLQFHACSHNGTAVECWGRNDSLQSDVPSDLGQPVQIAVGGTHSCVLQENQEVRCWGNNDSGQTQVPNDLGNVTSISAGFYHTCAANDVGDVNCWGANSFSQLDVPADIVVIGQVYSGVYNNCADTLDGIVCWGRNDYGQSSVWYDFIDFSVSSNQVCGITDKSAHCFGAPLNSDDVSDIDAPIAIGSGRYNSCVWASSGMHCWGQAGEQLNPPEALSGVTHIDGGNSQMCAISSAGVECWGSNNYGVLNVPSTLVQPTDLSSNTAHNCVIDGTTVQCWGDNRFGQSNARFNLLNPIDVATGGAFPNTSETGHTCVADDAGVQCWGNSDDGVLNVPSGLGSVIDLHAGWGVSCALQSNGAVDCWGDLEGATLTQVINIGGVTQLEGYNSKVCSRNENLIKCGSGAGALLLK